MSEKKNHMPISDFFRELKDQFEHEGVWFLALPGVFPVVALLSYISFKAGN